MSNMKIRRTARIVRVPATITAFLALAPAGCDEQRETADIEVVQDRGWEGEPQAWVVTSWDGSQIPTKIVSEIVKTCIEVSPPKWSCTFGAYLPDPAKSPDKVNVGIGCSAIGHMDYYKCVLALFLDNGAYDAYAEDDP